MDLSIPSVVDYRVQQLKNVHFLNVDSLSNVKDHTLKARVNQIPEAQIIIRQHVVQFLEWNQKRKFVPYLKMVKTTLHKINLDRERGHMTPSNEELNILVCDVQKEITQLAKKMEGNPNLGCCCIETISSYLKNNKMKMAEVVEV